VYVSCAYFIIMTYTQTRYAICVHACVRVCLDLVCMCLNCVYVFMLCVCVDLVCMCFALCVCVYVVCMCSCFEHDINNDIHII